MKIKGPLLALSLAVGACAHSQPPAPSSAPVKALETKLGKTSEALPFSMMGASEAEVISVVRERLQVLGPYTVLGPQSDGSVIECEVAPKGNSDMAMAMAIGNTQETLNQNPPTVDPSVTPTPIPDPFTHYPDVILMGSTSGELSSGEILTCIQTKRNPNAKPR